MPTLRNSLTSERTIWTAPNTTSKQNVSGKKWNKFFLVNFWIFFVHQIMDVSGTYTDWLTKLSRLLPCSMSKMKNWLLLHYEIIKLKLQKNITFDTVQWKFKGLVAVSFYNCDTIVSMLLSDENYSISSYFLVSVVV